MLNVLSNSVMRACVRSMSYIGGVLAVSAVWRGETMGQTLSEPVTAKESASCQNAQFRVGSSCMQGWRINMEDSHTHILSLPDDPDASFFAVYDGHGGEYR